ncbi:hypothetical protein COOONC_00063 [Cooperia oncophora]
MPSHYHSRGYRHSTKRSHHSSRRSSHHCSSHRSSHQSSRRRSHQSSSRPKCSRSARAKSRRSEGRKFQRKVKEVHFMCVNADEKGKALATIACKRVVFSPTLKKAAKPSSSLKKVSARKSSQRETKEAKDATKTEESPVELPETLANLTSSKEVKKETVEPTAKRLKRDSRGRLRDARGRFVREVKP